MGVYLSAPVTEKESTDGQCERFNYGASSMQGWRTAQEDAHNCIPLFDEKTKTSFFAVYDGHGGAEVAKYCQRHFPDFVKNLMEAQDGTVDLINLIKNAFLAFDATLTNDDVIKELKELAGTDDDEEDEDDDPVGRTETELLQEEANMPLDQLLAQYKSSAPEETKNFNEKDSMSPCHSSKSESTSNIGSSKQDVENGPSASTSSSSPCKENNLSQLCGDPAVSSQSSGADQSQTLETEKVTNDKQINDNNSIDLITSSTAQNNSSTVTDESSPPSSTTHEAAANHCTSELATGDSQTGVCNSSSSSDSSQPGGSSSGVVSSLNVNDEPSSSGTSLSAGVRSSKAKAAVDMAMVDEDIDTSDDDDADAWEDMSDEDDEEEEEDERDEDVPMMNTSDDPGADSGCTACVVLVQEKKLIVANAGDSRCVLSRAGKAVDLSVDHKPEDDSEKERIEKAGGKVTADGRVNGGLNLSRAIGDHVYKQNTDLPAEEQMITALPDVETAELCDEDQFIVIACDGIWNYMSSQEVVEFVLERLKDPGKRQKPSAICEELFDHCLAPNTSGDGTGCDNMTCIIIVMDTFINSPTQQPINEAAHTTKVEHNDAENTPEQQLNKVNEMGDAGSGSLKRCAENIEVREQKRLKVNEVV